MRTNRQEKIVSLLLMLFCVVYFIFTFRIRSVDVKTIPDSYMPRLCIVLLFITLTANLYTLCKNEKTKKTTAFTQKKLQNQKTKRTKLFFVICVFFATILLFWVAGFVISMAVFLMCFFVGLAPPQEKNYKLFVPLAILLPLGIHLLFLNVFYILLPPGILTFLG
jgi:hypothetical protein